MNKIKDFIKNLMSSVFLIFIYFLLLVAIVTSCAAELGFRWSFL